MAEEGEQVSTEKHELKVNRRRITPTDLSQYLRLGQCERYLRLRLHERSEGRDFFAEHKVHPQQIPPLLTLSGREFEQRTEAAMRAAFPVVQCAEAVRKHGGTRPPDNDRVLERARNLPAGSVLILCQPRLEVEIDGWKTVGDVDILRLAKDELGRLNVLIADIKSSTTSKVDHRLQVAFYHVMLDRLFQNDGVDGEIKTAILYRGTEGSRETGELGEQGSPAEERTRQEEETQRELARDLLGVTEGLLEHVPDPGAYRMAVHDLVTGPESVAERVARSPFEEIFFALSDKCDQCLYNEFCLKDSFTRNDLSLIPYLEPPDKRALLAAGVETVVDAAMLKEFRPKEDGATGRPGHLSDLQPTPQTAPVVQRLGSTSVGSRLDEIIHRARSTRKPREMGLKSYAHIPSRSHPSLPLVTPEKHANLVSIYIDAGYDYLHDRIYLLSARVAAHENGEPARSRTVVHLSDGPPDTPEKEERLFSKWIYDLLHAVVELAAPDAQGEKKAPIHLIFWNASEQKLLLEGLSRNLDGMAKAAPAVYDFVTQIAAYDSPIASFLEDEIRERRNLPLLCPSLQAVAAIMKFRWNGEGEDEQYREIFRERVFDYVGKEGEEYYTRRARYRSEIPLEYAYVAWGDLPEPADGGEDPYAPYRKATLNRLAGFQERRLEAMEWIADQLDKNKLSEKTPFTLPDLAEFQARARHLAQALDEFLTLERHVELASWKAIRLLPPERRVLMGETLLVRYVEEDQDVGVAEQNRDNIHRSMLQERYKADYYAAHPEAKRAVLTTEQKSESKWSQAGMRFRLRFELDGVDGDLDTALGLCNLREGDTVVLYPRLTQDSRLPEAERTDNTPTPKQMLYGERARIVEIHVEKDAAGRAVFGSVEIEMSEPRGGTSARGYTFSGRSAPLKPGAAYTLDSDPNDFMGMWCAKVAEALCDLEDGREAARHTLYDRLAHPEHAQPTDWPEAAVEAQQHFLVGLAMFHKRGLMHSLEESKHRYIGVHGGDPILLVQGPPGTGKSYSTAFAVLARVQGALAAGKERRVLLSCKTHAATDVLMEAVLGAVEKLRELRESDPALWRQYFDDRLLDVPLMRYRPKGTPPPGITAMPKDDERPDGVPCAADRILAEPFVIAAATPGGIYDMVRKRWSKKNDSLFGHTFCDLLVLDEASQMSLPEAMLAALPLSPTGQLLVVGDPRQMPPIVKHDWENEPRRTFEEYRSYESLFQTLLAKRVPLVQFAESFRLHAAMAEFLREEIYRHDGIRFFSRRETPLPEQAHDDPFVAAALSPEHPIVVIVHDEAGSQTLNEFERRLVSPVLKALADGDGYGFDAAEGLGVVVPHRAQRAALKHALPELVLLDPVTGEVRAEAVDTVERFQGAEREVILVSTTESDREYLQRAGEFLLNPCRLTVALSRAKTKMILVASESVFRYFSSDEELFANSQIWKNLLRRTCTEKLWEGEMDGHTVTVWGNSSI